MKSLSSMLLREALLKAPPIHRLDGGKISTKINVAIEKAHKIKSLHPIQLQALQYLCLAGSSAVVYSKVCVFSHSCHKDRFNISARKYLVFYSTTNQDQKNYTKVYLSEFC